MDNDDWDLFSIVRSCNATTFTTSTNILENPPPPQIETTTNNITFPQSVTPFFFDDSTFNQENSSVSFAPLKPNDFIDLDKLMINFNPIPNPATTSMPKINTTTTTTYTIPSPLTTTIPTHITNINTSVHIIHTPTITTPTTPPTVTPIITATIITPTTTTPIISATSTTMTNTSVHETNQYPTNYNFPILVGQQQIQQNINNQASVPKPVTCIDITTAHFERAYNHPSVITPTTTTPIISATNTTMTNTSVHETNQNPTNYNFPRLVGQQQIQQNINNQASVPKPVACIDITTAHFERVYNHPSVALCGSRKRKHNNQMSFVCYVREDELSKDPWAWRKYGQKLIKGSPHPRSYYKCSTWTDCPARRKIEKCKTQESTYIVTYEGEHNHAKPAFNKNVVVGTSQRKSLETGLHTAEEAGSSTNITNSGSPNVVMLQTDHLDNNNAQVLADQPKIPYPKMKLLESLSSAVEEVGSSSNVRNLGSHNNMILQFDEPQSSDVTGVVGGSNLPYSETGFIGSFDDNDDILIPNITAWSDDYLMNFNRLNGGAQFP